MLIPIKKLFRRNEEPVHIEGILHMEGQDFPGFTIPEPVAFTFDAVPQGGSVRLVLELDAGVHAVCARCLGPVEQREHIQKEYYVREDDLAEAFPELPFVAGKLDVDEMAYGELVMEVPPALLCREDCHGLCPECGKPKAKCGCKDAQEGDPRWQALRDLLEE